MPWRIQFVLQNGLESLVMENRISFWFGYSNFKKEGLIIHYFSNSKTKSMEKSQNKIILIYYTWHIKI